jgi:hypothetical protein
MMTKILNKIFLIFLMTYSLLNLSIAGTIQIIVGPENQSNSAQGTFFLTNDDGSNVSSPFQVVSKRPTFIPDNFPIGSSISLYKIDDSGNPTTWGCSNIDVTQLYNIKSLSVEFINGNMKCMTAIKLSLAKLNQPLLFEMGVAYDPGKIESSELINELNLIKQYFNVIRVYRYNQNILEMPKTIN